MSRASMYVENISDFFISELLAKYQIDRVFVYPGGTIAPLVNSAIKYGLIVETFKTEQGAGYAAMSFAVATGIPQLVLVTSGPGLTNVISSICDSYYDSIPLIFVSGQVGTGDLLSRRDVRQLGFQQVDGVAMLSGVTKHARCMYSLDDFKNIKALFELVVDKRPGPIYLELPMDVQRTALQTVDDFPKPEEDTSIYGEELPDISDDSIEKMYELLGSAQRPLAIIGAGGISNEDTRKLLLKWVNFHNIPFVTSFRGVGFSDYDSVLNQGYLGHTGHEQANRAVFASDLLIVLGSRLDIRQTGTEVSDFAKNKTIVSVNNDYRELKYTRIKIDLPILGNLGPVIEKMLLNGLSPKTNESNVWFNELSSFKCDARNDQFKDGRDFESKLFVKYVSSITKNKSLAVVTGVGAHQHWVARHFNFCLPTKRFFSSSGHGTMGFDVPSAVGAAMSGNFDLTICFVGDGSIMHNICELRSAVDRDLNIVFVVFKNKRLGIVSQFQKITFGTDPTTSEFQSGDICKVAEGFGLIGKHFDDVGTSGLEEFLLFECRPRLLVVDIPPEEDVTPMLLGGSTLNDLWKLS